MDWMKVGRAGSPWVQSSMGRTTAMRGATGRARDGVAGPSRPLRRPAECHRGRVPRGMSKR
jgi:hypothetical protein